MQEGREEISGGAPLFLIPGSAPHLYRYIEISPVFDEFLKHIVPTKEVYDVTMPSLSVGVVCKFI